MRNGLNMATGAGIGAAMMYFLDPNRGRRRRAGVRDQMLHAAHEVKDGLDVTQRDILNRAQGMASKAKGMVSREKVDDAILVARVRSRLGRVVSHPHAIQVLADQGHVTLMGVVLREELDDLVSSVSSVKGVKMVHSDLDVRDEPEHVSSLQGGRVRHGERFELLQKNWSPSARFFVSSIGLGSLIYGISRRGFAGTLLAGAGMGFLIRAVSNLDTKRLLGLRGAPSIAVHKTIEIDAPVERVFSFWNDFRNFPRFMPDVNEVRSSGPNRFHWAIRGPAGIPVQWDATLIRIVPNELLAWRSEPGSLIRHAGQIRFQRSGRGGTRMDVDLLYSPPAGALGHFLASIFHSDPKSRMDEDLMRVKSYLEHGPSERQMRRASAVV